MAAWSKIRALPLPLLTLPPTLAPASGSARPVPSTLHSQLCARTALAQAELALHCLDPPRTVLLHQLEELDDHEETLFQLFFLVHGLQCLIMKEESLLFVFCLEYYY